MAFHTQAYKLLNALWLQDLYSLVSLLMCVIELAPASNANEPKFNATSAGHSICNI